MLVLASGATAQTLDGAASAATGEAGAGIGASAATPSTDTSAFSLRTSDAAADTTPDLSAAAAAPRPAATPTLAIDENTFGRMNVRESADNIKTGTIDNLRARPQEIDAPGIRVGTFIIRPTAGQGIGVEQTKSGSTTTTRSFLQTTGKLQIISDWSLHQLTINAAGVWQTNIGGSGQTKPTANVDAKLRLDVDKLTTANLTSAYSFQRESTTDPNSISGASVQSGIHTFQGGADLTREFGHIRGTIGGTLTRTVYSAATLSDGSNYAMSDRNQTEADLKLRVGYEVSPAVIPFIEFSGGRIFRDQTYDRSGYNRNADIYAAKAGVELDFGEKLRGEVSGGYKRVNYKDARLSSIDAFTLDGTMYWSPVRGTNVTLGLTTGIDPSTTAGVSGSTYYTVSAGLTQEMIDNLTGRLSGSTTFRKFYPTAVASDQTEWVAGAGLTWSLSRYIELAGDLNWNYTDVKTGTDTTTWSAIAELRVKR